MKRSLHILFSILVLTSFVSAQDWASHQPKLTAQKSGTKQLLIAVSPVNDRVVWASGAGGTYVVTTNGGATWKAGVVPGASKLQFRDVYAVSDKVAYLLSIGNAATDFRIYKTVDGGAHWTIEFTNHKAAAFYDCFSFWSPNRGIAHSDSSQGVFPDLRTFNGKTWNSIASFMPPALAGEASFASSGTCVTTEGERNAWIATGGATVARILATRDGGQTWNAYDTPLEVSASGGALSVAFRDAWNGMVGGGDLANNKDADTAISHDGGRTWTLTKKPPIAGTIFCLAYVQGLRHRDYEDDRDRDHGHAVVVTAETAPNFTSGPAAWTPDEGHTWFVLPKEANGFWAVAFSSPEAGWFVGNNGKILKISFDEDHHD